MAKTIILALYISLASTASEVRIIEFNGKKVRTTFAVPEKFYGEYTGRKKGFLKLNQDGTGEYHYDVFGFAPADCIAQTISLEWGFIVSDTDSIVFFEREYGRSYPILLKSTSKTKFQGCRKEIILDFIMEYKDGSLGVSSSDDWKKN